MSAQENPWDVLPILAVGDPTPDGLYSAVGQALTAWEKLDQLQGTLFGMMVGSRSGAATAAYATVIGFQARNGMVIAAVDAALENEPAILAIVRPLLIAVGRLSGRRNDIAHGIVSHLTAESRDKNGLMTLTDEGHFLVPSLYAANKRAKGIRDFAESPTASGKYAYTSAQVLNYASRFAECYGRLVNDVLPKMHALYPPSTPPEASPPPDSQR